jgi:hypothetical protein
MVNEQSVPTKLPPTAGALYNHVQARYGHMARQYKGLQAPLEAQQR